MRKLKQYAVYAALALLPIAAVLLMLGMDSAQRRLATCEGLRVSFVQDYNFVSAAQVENLLKEEYGAYIGQRLDSVDLAKIERILDGKGAILKGEAFVTKDRQLNIEITQRKPVLRLQGGSGGFYCDADGFIFPASGGSACRVPVVDGDLPFDLPAGFRGEAPEGKGRQWLAGLIEMAEYMEGSKAWAGGITQMRVGRDKGLVLVPSAGSERFIFGGPEGYKEKFARMEDYYRYVVPQKGEGFYTSVNVKFGSQIVCKK